MEPMTESRSSAWTELSEPLAIAGFDRLGGRGNGSEVAVMAVDDPAIEHFPRGASVAFGQWDLDEIQAAGVRRRIEMSTRRMRGSQQRIGTRRRNATEGSERSPTTQAGVQRGRRVRSS